MDIDFQLNGIHFIWNADKASKNMQRHDGVSFQQAAEVFFDPFLKIVDVSPEDEERDAVIGMDRRWNLLFVVHIAFDDDAIRLISARKATREERRYYEA